MVQSRHEQYENYKDGLPFIFHADITRSDTIRSSESNWHDNLEIQLCTGGRGLVLVDGQSYNFEKNDIIVINSDVLHYTGTNGALSYCCLIIGTEFCRQLGIDTNIIYFSPFIRSEKLCQLIYKLSKLYLDEKEPLRVAKLNNIVIEILIELAQNHTEQKKDVPADVHRFETVKAAISYMRNNYSEKLTLDMIAREAACDKYALCRDFKKLTNQTVFDNLNSYRCIKAAEFIKGGYTVTKAASACGFDNLSFFTKTFKKHMGKLPSCCKTKTGDSSLF